MIQNLLLDTNSLLTQSYTDRREWKQAAPPNGTVGRGAPRPLGRRRPRAQIRVLTEQTRSRATHPGSGRTPRTSCWDTASDYPSYRVLFKPQQGALSSRADIIVLGLHSTTPSFQSTGLAVIRLRTFSMNPRRVFPTWPGCPEDMLGTRIPHDCIWTSHSHPRRPRRKSPSCPVPAL